MHDSPGQREDDKPMIPDGLTPRQQAEDPVANDADAAGAGSEDGHDAEKPVDDRP